MLKVKRKSWAEILIPRRAVETETGEFASGHCPLRLWTFLTASMFLVGFFNRVGLVLGLAFFLFAMIVNWRTYALAKGLRLSRLAPEHATERDFIEISYEVMNTSAFALTHYFVVDRFSGSKSSRVFIDGNLEIGRASSQVFKFRRKCDSGMGVKEFGPLTAIVTDPLGLFEFNVTEDEVATIEVFPKLEPIPLIPLMGSSDSFLYGLYDVQARGGSVNFMGIRDYSPGDSLRHISWRLSAKNSKLLVKEFEKVVNTDVTLVLNMDGREHMGQHAESTWEFMKDIALALVTQQVAAGNGLQLISNRAFVPMARGENQAHDISLKIFDLKPRIDREEVPPLRKYRSVISRGSTLIYLSPVFSEKAELEIEQLKLLRAEGVLTRTILLDAASFISGKIHWNNRAEFEGQLVAAKERLREVVRVLALEGIPTHLVGMSPSVGKELLRPPIVEARTSR